LTEPVQEIFSRQGAKAQSLKGFLEFSQLGAFASLREEFFVRIRKPKSRAQFKYL
jgi:hypothetical protein